MTTLKEIDGFWRWWGAWLVSLILIGVATLLGEKSLELLGHPLSEDTGNAVMQMAHDLKPTGFVALIAMTTFVEELVFRTLPVVTAMFVARWFKVGKSVPLITVGIVSTLVFAYVHGSLLNIVVQGVGGGILYVFFMMSGGLSGRLVRATLGSWSVHVAFDLIVIGAVLAGLVDS